MKSRKPPEFEQITTRGGDRGTSSLFNGERRRKDDPLFETLGDLDELTSALGVVKAGIRQFPPVPPTDRRLQEWLETLDEIQGDLVLLGGMVADPDCRSAGKRRRITSAQTEKLERREKNMMQGITLSREFIHPGETLVSAWTDMARTVCRRCERRLVTCIRDGVMPHLIPCQVYLNRLSDYLFVSARYWEQTGRADSGNRTV